MLLRSSTAPITSSWLPHSKEPSPEPEQVLHLPRTLSTPIQNMVDADPRSHIPSKPETNTCMQRSNVFENQRRIKMKGSDEVEEAKKKNKGTPPSVRELFSISGLDEKVVEHGEGYAGKKGSRLQTLVMGGGMGSNGGYNGSGRGSDGGHGWDFSEENNHGRDWTDAYYQNMIEANPNNALLLGNYAKFLKEVIRFVLVGA